MMETILAGVVLFALAAMIGMVACAQFGRRFIPIDTGRWAMTAFLAKGVVFSLASITLAIKVILR